MYRMSKIPSSFLRIAVALSLTMLLQGCDFIRILAGRETSADLEDIRAEKARVAAEEARKRAEDSLARAIAAKKDSLRILDSVIVASAGKGDIPQFRKVEELAMKLDTLPDFRYALMMGYFRNESNASRLYALIAEDGFSPVVIRFAGGGAGVAVFPSETADQVLKGYLLVKKKPYCPEDAWVIWNESWCR